MTENEHETGFQSASYIVSSSVYWLFCEKFIKLNTYDLRTFLMYYTYKDFFSSLREGVKTTQGIGVGVTTSSCDFKKHTPDSAAKTKQKTWQ